MLSVTGLMVNKFIVELIPVSPSLDARDPFLVTELYLNRSGVSQFEENTLFKSASLSLSLFPLFLGLDTG